MAGHTSTPQEAKPTLLRIPAETFSRPLLMMLVMLMILILIYTLNNSTRIVPTIITVYIIKSLNYPENVSILSS